MSRNNADTGANSALLHEKQMLWFLVKLFVSLIKIFKWSYLDKITPERFSALRRFYAAIDFNIVASAVVA